MKILDLKETENLVFNMAKKINASRLPTFGNIEGTGRPAVKVDSHGYHYILSHKGSEHRHHLTQDIKELLYWIFEDVTLSMAFNSELRNRVEKKDFRRTIFKKQVELLNELDREFAVKAQVKADERLRIPLSVI